MLLLFFFSVLFSDLVCLCLFCFLPSVLLYVSLPFLFLFKLFFSALYLVHPSILSSSIFSFPLFSCCSFLCFLFIPFILFLFFPFSPLLSFICYSCSYCWFFIIHSDPPFSLFIFVFCFILASFQRIKNVYVMQSIMLWSKLLGTCMLNEIQYILISLSFPVFLFLLKKLKFPIPGFSLSNNCSI